MRAVVQRVLKASVKTENRLKEIHQGLLIFSAVLENDTQKEAKRLAEKILKMRIFDDSQGVMNKSIKDINGEALIIPQFTLYAELKKGNRPYYGKASSPEKAKSIIKIFSEIFQGQISIKEGFFGEEMFINSVNHGPVTIIIDTDEI